MIAFLRRLLFVYLRPHRLRGLALLGCILLAIAFDTLFPLGIKFIIDLAITPRNPVVFVQLVAGLTVLYVVASLANPALDYLMIWLTAAVLNELRRRMFSHLNALSAGTHQRLEAGEVLNRFGSDLATMEYGFYYAVVPGIVHALGLLVGALVLFQLDWRLALLTVVLLPLPLLIPRGTIRAATTATFARKASESAITGAVQEALLAQQTTRALGLAKHTEAGFETRLSGYAHETLRADFLQWLAYRITNAGQYLIQLLVIAVGGYLALQGQLSVGSLVGFTSLLFNLGASVTQVSNAMAALIPTVTSSERIEGLLASSSSRIRPIALSRLTARGLRPLTLPMRP